MDFSKITNKGKVRKNNEDYLYANNKNIGPLENLYVVCDGVGGNNCGELASKLSIKTFTKFVSKLEKINDLYISDIRYVFQEGVKKSEKVLLRTGNKKLKAKGMCTTFLASTIYKGIMYAYNIGDSRCYVITNSKSKNENGDTVLNISMDQVTIDNVEIIEERVIPKDVVDDNSITNLHVAKRKYLSKSLGYTKDVVGDFYQVDLNKKIENNDEVYILLCTDGLYNMLNENEIKDIILNSKLNIKHKTKQLIKMALNAGGIDNISAILVEVK